MNSAKCISFLQNTWVIIVLYMSVSRSYMETHRSSIDFVMNEMSCVTVKIDRLIK